MSTKIYKERHGRKFRCVGRWSELEDTIISNNHRFAKYATNTGNAGKLWITCFKCQNKSYPYARFADLEQKMILDDFTILSKYDTENSAFFLAIDNKNHKIKLYQEVFDIESEVSNEN